MSKSKLSGEYSTDVEIGPVKLAVMTIGFSLKSKFNLNILAEHLKLDDTTGISGIRYLDRIRGHFSEQLKDQLKYVIQLGENNPVDYIKYYENGDMECTYQAPYKLQGFETLSQSNKRLVQYIYNYLFTVDDNKHKVVITHGNRKKKNLIEREIGLTSYWQNENWILDISNFQNINRVYEVINMTNIMDIGQVNPDYDNNKIVLSVPVDNLENTMPKVCQIIGDLLEFMKRRDKNYNKKRKDFSNQCSFYVDGYNVKLFSNGKIIITGCRNLEILPILIEKVVTAIKTVTPKESWDLVDLNKKSGPKSGQVLQWFEFCELVRKQEGETYRKMCSEVLSTQFDLSNQNDQIMNLICRLEFLRTYYFQDEKLNDELSRIVQILNECEDVSNYDWSNDTIYGRFLHYVATNQSEYTPDTLDKPWVFPVYLGEPFNNLDYNDYTVNLINSTFKTNLRIDRQCLLNIIKERYGQNIVSSCNDKERYCGLTLKYRLSNDSLASIHIFGAKKGFPPVGSVNIAVPQSWNLVMEAYDFIVNIFRKHYKEFRIIPNECLTLPPDLIKIGNDNSNEKFYLINRDNID